MQGFLLTRCGHSHIFPQVFHPHSHTNKSQWHTLTLPAGQSGSEARWSPRWKLPRNLYVTTDLGRQLLHFWPQHMQLQSYMFDFMKGQNWKRRRRQWLPENAQAEHRRRGPVTRGSRNLQFQFSNIKNSPSQTTEACRLDDGRWQ